MEEVTRLQSRKDVINSFFVEIGAGFSSLFTGFGCMYAGIVFAGVGLLLLITTPFKTIWHLMYPPSMGTTYTVSETIPYDR
jgi:hypothetical protein